MTTPGPWSVVKGDALWKITIGTGHKAMTIAEAIREEDAQLMAIVPELLEVAEKALKKFKELDAAIFKGVDREKPPIIKQLEAVISKARQDSME